MSSSYQWPGCNCYGFFYNWIISKGNSCARVPVTATLNCPLPLDWLSFNVQKQQAKTVLVSWTTVNENNVLTFEIERSSDGIHFETIGMIAATGNNTVSSYSYTDNTIVESGTYYYRIKENDANGLYTFSAIQAIIIATPFSIYPNPTSGVVHIVFTENLGPGSYVVIYDALGRELNQIPVAASNQSDIDLSAYASGVYVLKIVSLNDIFIDKVVRK
jgi:hypothetical protein